MTSVLHASLALDPKGGVHASPEPGSREVKGAVNAADDDEDAAGTGMVLRGPIALAALGALCAVCGAGAMWLYKRHSNKGCPPARA